MIKRIKERITNSLSYQIVQLAVDLLLQIAALYVAIPLRVFLDEAMPAEQLNSFLPAFFLSVPLYAFGYIVCFFLSGLHRVYWPFASVKDMLRVAFSALGSAFFAFLLGTLFGTRLPRLVYLLALLLTMGMLAAFRMLLRYRGRRGSKEQDSPVKESRVMIVGAGRVGNILLHEFHDNDAYSKSRVVCVVDDDPMKIGKLVYTVPVVGSTEGIPEYAKQYRVDLIVFAICQCSATRRAEILAQCMKTGCTVRTIPSISSLIDGEVSLHSMQQIRVEDLLGREPIRINSEQLSDSVRDKVVLVTGGGGSIGSELCRQIASFAPKKLVILDIYENNAYDIQNELRAMYPELVLDVRIASVRDVGKLERLFAELRPQVVYHAAAHKHVPLMEDAPDEAVKNNIFGTLNTVQMSERYGVERFVLISTDKAVNPTNIMGATKRVCEMIVQTFNRESHTDFVAVRFGNVLGSNGSVIPLFKKQIEQGGPVTVTHPDIIRYFMTIPEAVSLVMQAGATAKGGEIFVLDMGKPVRILDLAENLIRLSGHVPNVDIPIRFTGLRPGEKLYEELLMDEEGLRKTENSLIYIGKPIELDESEFYADLSELRKTALSGGDVLLLMHKLVPTFRASEKTTV